MYVWVYKRLFFKRKRILDLVYTILLSTPSIARRNWKKPLNFSLNLAHLGLHQSPSQACNFSSVVPFSFLNCLNRVYCFLCIPGNAGGQGYEPPPPQKKASGSHCRNTRNSCGRPPPPHALKIRVVRAQLCCLDVLRNGKCFFSSFQCRVFVRRPFREPAGQCMHASYVFDRTAERVPFSCPACSNFEFCLRHFPLLLSPPPPVSDGNEPGSARSDARARRGFGKLDSGSGLEPIYLRFL